MAGKSPTELIEMIAVLRQEVAVLTSKTDGFREQFGPGDVAAVFQRLAVLEAYVADLRKSKETDDQRRWQFWVGVGTVVLTFVANLTVNLLLYFARR